MKSPKEFKIRAIRLRNKGLSYNEIKRHVPVAKSTLSLWLKSIRLSKEHRSRLYTKQIAILSRGPQSQKERRALEIKKIIQTAAKEITMPLTLDTYRLMGAALYWAEGNKKNGFQITNSDPNFILFMVRWIEKVLKISAKSLKARLNIYPQQDENSVKKFWSDLTGIPLIRFGKSYIKPISSGFKKNNLYYGTMNIEVPRGTDMRHRIFGWLSAVLKDIEPKTILIERKWVSLQNISRQPINLT